MRKIGISIGILIIFISLASVMKLSLVTIAVLLLFGISAANTPSPNKMLQEAKEPPTAANCFGALIAFVILAVLQILCFIPGYFLMWARQSPWFQRHLPAMRGLGALVGFLIIWGAAFLFLPPFLLWWIVIPVVVYMLSKILIDLRDIFNQKREIADMEKADMKKAIDHCQQVLDKIAAGQR